MELIHLLKTGSSEHGNEPSGSIKGTHFLHQQSNY